MSRTDSETMIIESQTGKNEEKKGRKWGRKNNRDEVGGKMGI